jgi:hypothetical protein
MWIATGYMNLTTSLVLVLRLRICGVLSVLPYTPS